MQWFKHYNDARHNPKFRAIEKKLGEAGYARAFKLFEIVAERGGKADKFTPVLDLKELRTNLDWLADEWRITTGEAKNTLEIFASVELIDPKALSKDIIRISQMIEYLDEWTQRRQPSKTPRVAPERLPSNSRATPAQSKSKRTEEEAEAETARQRKERIAAVAAADELFLKKKTEGCWTSIRIAPCGLVEFQETWQSIWGKWGESERLSDLMERCIQACGQVGVRVPGPFYDAKRKVQSREDEEVGACFDEVERVAGPRGVPEELMR